MFEDTNAVEASRLEGILLQDEMGEHRNYMSFVQAGANAQDLLEKMVEEGRVTELQS